MGVSDPVIEGCPIQGGPCLGALRVVTGSGHGDLELESVGWKIVICFHESFVNILLKYVVSSHLYQCLTLEVFWVLSNVWWCFCDQNSILRTQFLFLSISLCSNWFHYRLFYLTLKFPRTIDDVLRLTVSYRNFKLLRGIFGATCLGNQRIHLPYLHDWIFTCTGLNGSFNWYPSVVVPYPLCHNRKKFILFTAT